MNWLLRPSSEGEFFGFVTKELVTKHIKPDVFLGTAVPEECVHAITNPVLFASKKVFCFSEMSIIKTEL